MNNEKRRKHNVVIASVALVVCLLFPFALNWLLLREAIVPVVGDGATWLSFWPVYLSAIASFGMIFFTYLSLQQNKKQIEELRRQREEEERARLVFSVIVYQTAFMLKISNIGKRNVFNAIINFNEDFLNELIEKRFQEGFRQLKKPFFVEVGTSRYLYIGHCPKVNNAWKEKQVVIKMKGSYNDNYTIDEVIDMSWFLDKTFIEVQGDLETTMNYMKKGLIVQNNEYMPVQKSLDIIAKSIRKVDCSLEEINEKMSANNEKMSANNEKVEINSQMNSEVEVQEEHKE